MSKKFVSKKKLTPTTTLGSLTAKTVLTQSPVKSPTLKAQSDVLKPSTESFDAAFNRLAVENGKPAPKKRGRKTDAERAAMGIPISIPVSTPGVSAGTSPSTPISPPLSLVTLEEQARMIPDAVVKPVVNFPFRFFAGKTGFKGFYLEKDEEAEIVPAAKLVAAKWLPSLTGQSSPEIILLSTVAFVFGNKWMMYQDYLAAEKEKEGDLHRAFKSETAQPEMRSN